MYTSCKYIESLIRVCSFNFILDPTLIVCVACVLLHHDKIYSSFQEKKIMLENEQLRKQASDTVPHDTLLIVVF